MFGHAVKEGLIDPERSVQIGIRTTFVGETTMGFRIIYADEVHNSSIDQIAKVVTDKVGKQKAYLTFDIDCLDPSMAPGTGTPEAGGFTTREAQQMLRLLDGVNIVGADVVEVAPPFDLGNLTSLAGATMMFEILCIMAKGVAARKKPR